MAKQAEQSGRSDFSANLDIEARRRFARFALCIDGLLPARYIISRRPAGPLSQDMPNFGGFFFAPGVAHPVAVGNLAVMNLAVRGIEAHFGCEQADTFRRDLHKDLCVQLILANGRTSSGQFRKTRSPSICAQRCSNPSKLDTACTLAL